jgi:N utilization substance protein B
MSSKSPRRRAREFVIQGLYQWQVGDQDAAAIQVQAESVAGFDKADNEFSTALLAEARHNVETHSSSTCSRTSTANGTRSRRSSAASFCWVPASSSCILETPYRVIINEAIELAKTYGGTDGHKFVNGVLDKLATVLRAAEIRKP